MLVDLLIVASEAPEEEGGSALIEPIPGLMIWTLISFGITVWVLKRFAFGPIQKIIDERRQRIRESIEEADRARSEARKLLEEHKQLRANARGEAEGILSEARRVADSMAQRMKEETESERQRRLEETRKQVEAETARALEQIRTEIASLALVAAEKVTREALDRHGQKKLIEDAVRDLDFSALEKRSS
ncbi:MAG: F0F1 ATP synthase subunit B [Actinomycetota bacterium]|nr:F0F1 ATP synthase subunit B [Actinomycetota bacterium]